MPGSIRILLVADSHLGFDLPVHTRVRRRRRGHDFLANHALALAPALAGEVDLVVHGGDVFDRPVVPRTLAYQAFEPLLAVAERGVPVFIVPGNHERSRLPHRALAGHACVHVFDRARTFAIDVGGTRVALSGFPYERHGVRRRFRELLQASGWREHSAALRLLCVHHCVEGATVGPAGFTFTRAPDVIRIRDIPADFAAVLSGHIHRHQVLTTDLQDQPVPVPVMYPGSIERTALAELGEPKGFMVVRVEANGGRPNVEWEFRRLPARPMLLERLHAPRCTPAQLEQRVRALVAAAPPDAVLIIRIAGELSATHLRSLSAAQLRTFVPETMNVEIQTSLGAERAKRPLRVRRSARAAPAPSRGAVIQLDLIP